MSNTRPVAVTSGRPFIDIDGFACAVAYAELLNHEGRRARPVLVGPLNESITPTVRSWGADFDTTAEPGAQAILVDISDTSVLPDFADPDNVIEVFDHHTGFETFWDKRLGKHSHIEFVGACATLIWEEIGGRADVRLSQTSARLLHTAILSNTLNFNADLTCDRDHRAYAETGRLANLGSDWAERYYDELERVVLANVPAAIANDTKIVEIPNLNTTLTIGQLELWDGRGVIERHADEIGRTLAGFGDRPWFHSSPSISERKNYLYCTNPQVQNWLEQALGTKFQGHFAQTQRLWMRKEILKALFALAPTRG